MNDSKKIELIKEALEDWGKKKLSDWTFIFIVHTIINGVEPSKESMEWGERELKRLKIKGKE